MISATTKIILNTDIFEKQLEGDINKMLHKMGSIGVANISNETPVDKGHLLAMNDYGIDDGVLYFINVADYAAYVEFGTYKMAPNPFMRRGIFNSLTDFQNVANGTLSV